MEKKQTEFLGLNKVEGKTEKIVVGYVEGWTKAYVGKNLLWHNCIKGADGKWVAPEGKKATAKMLINGSFNEKELTFLFGDEISKCINKGHLDIAVTVFDYKAVNLANYNPTLKQKIGFSGIAKLDTSEYEGKERTFVALTAQNWKPVTKLNEEAGRVGVAYGSGTSTTNTENSKAVGEPVIGEDIPF